MSYRRPLLELKTRPRFCPVNNPLTKWRHNTQHNSIQPKETQHNDTQHKGLISDFEHNDTQHNDIQHNKTLPLC